MAGVGWSVPAFWLIACDTAKYGTGPWTPPRGRRRRHFRDSAFAPLPPAGPGRVGHRASGTFPRGGILIAEIVLLEKKKGFFEVAIQRARYLDT